VQEGEGRMNEQDDAREWRIELMVAEIIIARNSKRTVSDARLSQGLRTTPSEIEEARQRASHDPR